MTFDDETFSYLTELKSLEDLELDIEEIDPSSLLPVLMNLPSLRRLQCDFYCDRDQGIED
eukprot:Awhi_evm1s12983